MNSTFCDKDCALTLLSGEKLLASTYNTALLECATPEMRRTVSELLADTHNAQQQLFEEMNSRGWYPVTKAEEQKITQARQKFAPALTK